MVVVNLNMLTDPVFQGLSDGLCWTRKARLATRGDLRRRGDDPIRICGHERSPQSRGLKIRIFWAMKPLDVINALRQKENGPAMASPVRSIVAKAVSGLATKLLRQETRGEPTWAYYPARRSLSCAGYPFVAILSSAQPCAGLGESFQP